MNEDTFLEATIGLAYEAPYAFLIADREGHALWANPAFVSMCGHELEEIVGRKPGPLLQGPDTSPVAAAELSRAVQESRSCRVSLVNYHKSGRPYLVRIYLHPVRDLYGEVRFFCAVEFDITHETGNKTGLAQELTRIAAVPAPFSVTAGAAPAVSPNAEEDVHFSPIFKNLATPQLEQLFDDLVIEMRRRDAAALRDDYVAEQRAHSRLGERLHE
jgi:PAS domain S-box-containing protein